jgi:chromosome segregation ATPase
MKKRMLGLTLLWLIVGAPVLAADDAASARLRETLHRAQEALRQAQSDNADLTRAKTDLEQKLAAANKQLEAAQTGLKAAQSTISGKLASAETAQADTARKLEDSNSQLAAANTKLGETARQLAARESELSQLTQQFAISQAAVASCEDKNLKLYGYAQEVLAAYRKKGVWAALAQKDPVFGLKDVDVQNVVQEYQVKFAGQKVQKQ